VWHTGVLVFSVEYYFGGGIQAAPEGHFQQSNQLPPDRLISLGTTTRTQPELIAYLQSVSHQYTQQTYDLINNNCNNFSDCLCRFLLGGRGIPTEIVDLPRIVFSTPGGAMLRPMIENMQNNIRAQSGSGMDPFATASASSSMDSRDFENNLSNSVRTAVADLVHQRTSVATASPVTASLEEACLISSDSSSVKGLSRKILDLKDTDGHRVLRDEEVTLLEGIVRDLTGPTASSIVCPMEVYDLLQRLLGEYPQVQLPCLFLGRLLLLHDTRTDLRRVGFVQSLLRRLAAASKDNTQFASPSAHVMAVCAISNLLGNQHITNSLLIGGGEPSMSISDDVVNISMHGLGHSKTDMRLISATLAYNYVLLHTKDGRLSHLWSPSPGGSEAELNPHAMQLLLGALEGLTDESDSRVRGRRLSIVCRITRAYGEVAANLIRDLGLAELFDVLSSHQQQGAALTASERDMVDEIKQRIK